MRIDHHSSNLCLIKNEIIHPPGRIPNSIIFQEATITTNKANTPINLSTTLVIYNTLVTEYSKQICLRYLFYLKMGDNWGRGSKIFPTCKKQKDFDIYTWKQLSSKCAVLWKLIFFSHHCRKKLMLRTQWLNLSVEPIGLVVSRLLVLTFFKPLK